MQLLNPHGTATRADLVALAKILSPTDIREGRLETEVILYLNRDQRISGSLNEVQGTQDKS